MSLATKTGLLAAVFTVLFTTAVTAQDLPVTPAPEGAQVTIVSPKDGDTVGTEFVVIFGLEGMGVAPAGIDIEGTGQRYTVGDRYA